MEQYIGLIAFTAGLAVILAAYALFAPKKDARRRPQQSNRGINVRVEENSVGSKYIRPALGEFVPSVPGVSNLSDTAIDSITKLIIRSKNPWNLKVEEFRGTQFLFAVLGVAIGIALAPFGLLPVPWFILIPILGLAGFMIPFSVYNSARESNEKEIRKQLPEALDLLVITMSAGLTFERALSRVTEKMPDGLLQKEFTQMSLELQSGRTVEAVMSDFADRAASDEAQSFAQSVTSAKAQGADMSEILTSQAENARDAYEGVIDTKIAKLSTMMFAFLVPTMLPALMIIFLAPSLADLQGAFL